jgi:hypothetical protein
MSVRQIATLVRLENNAGYPGKEGSLAAFDRAWYKPDLAEKLGQQTRLLASPASDQRDRLRESCPPGSETAPDHRTGGD